MDTFGVCVHCEQLYPPLFPPFSIHRRVDKSLNDDDDEPARLLTLPGHGHSLLRGGRRHCRRGTTHNTKDPH